MDNITQQQFIDMLRGNSKKHQPQVCDLGNTFIVNADKYNVDAHGQTNIFITPCVFEKGKRTVAAWHQMNVAYAEIDDVAGDVSRYFTLKPTLLIKTSTKDKVSSYHVYWDLNEPIKIYNEALKVIDNLKTALSEVVDSNAIKLTQLYRMPYTMRQKESDRQGESVTSAVNPVYWNRGLKYDKEDFAVWASLGINTVKAIRTRPAKGDRSEKDYGVMMMLQQAGASKELIESIFKLNVIGSKYREEGQHYFDITYEQSGIMLQKQTPIPHYVTWNGSALSHAKKNSKEVLLASFSIKPRAKLLPIDDTTNQQALYTFTIPQDEEHKVYSMNSHQLTQKKEVAERVGLHNIYASQAQMALFQMYVTQEILKDGAVGYYTERAGFVKHDNTYYRVPSGSHDVVLHTNDDPIKDIRYNMRKGINNSKAQLEMLYALNDRDIVTMFAGWMTAIMFNGFIVEEELSYNMPLLALTGIAGSGKTTLVNIMMNFFGISGKSLEASTFAGKLTPWALSAAMGVSYTMPLFIKEWRVHDPANAATSGVLRSVYDRKSVTHRGVSSLKVNNYKLVRTVIIDGQDTPEEIAILARMIGLKLVKDGWTDPDALLNYTEYTTNTFAYHLINAVTDSLNKDRDGIKQQLQLAQEEVVEAFRERTISARVMQNMGVLWFGIKYLHNHAGIELPHIDILLDSQKDLYNKEFDYERNDASVLLEYIISTQPLESTVELGGMKQELSKFVTFNVHKKTRGMIIAFNKEGRSRSDTLTSRSYAEILDNHGRFIERVSSGVYRIDIEQAKACGL